MSFFLLSEKILDTRHKTRETDAETVIFSFLKSITLFVCVLHPSFYFSNFCDTIIIRSTIQEWDKGKR